MSGALLDRYRHDPALFFRAELAFEPWSRQVECAAGARRHDDAHVASHQRQRDGDAPPCGPLDDYKARADAAPPDDDAQHDDDTTHDAGHDHAGHDDGTDANGDDADDGHHHDSDDNVGHVHGLDDPHRHDDDRHLDRHDHEHDHHPDHHDHDADRHDHDDGSVAAAPSGRAGGD